VLKAGFWLQMLMIVKINRIELLIEFKYDSNFIWEKSSSKKLINFHGKHRWRYQRQVYLSWWGHVHLGTIDYLHSSIITSETFELNQRQMPELIWFDNIILMTCQSFRWIMQIWSVLPTKADWNMVMNCIIESPKWNLTNLNKQEKKPFQRG